ncbi:serine/threonine-protein kinase [Nocardiopsis sp. CNT312]|uniref:serine/threonine-protein kinase n=1 Tax=Nocardiopsis sp. CNT312 TaxID=1137268 RepID=UPI0004AF3E1E|nr:serine/threonine-protein kinase [Nocardiopsis sp. CNT312]
MTSPGRSSVGRYELRERLGAGGMGTVWRAWDPSLQREVAVKEVRLPEGIDHEARTEAYERTMREAQATARIHSPAVVAVHDVLEEDGSPWIVMELLSGVSLQQRLETLGPMPADRVEETALSVLRGLKAAHAAGVAHRDIKPANIMLTDDERTVVTDFGIANVDGSTALTQTGVFIGSPEYMAPERFEGERALPSSDLWSLGVTLYALLEGRSPFKRDSITGIISAVLTAPLPPRPTGPDLPEPGDRAGAPLRALIAALLDRDPSARPTPDEALDLLRRERAALATGGGPAEGASGPQAPQSGSQQPQSGPQRPPTPGTRPVPPTTHPPHSPVPHPVYPGGGGQPQHPSGPQGPPRTVPTGRVGPGAPVGGGTGYVTAGPRYGYPGSTTGGGPLPSGSGAGKPGTLIAASGMLGVNALYLMVITALQAFSVASGSGSADWGPVLLVGAWGLFSAFSALGLMTGSRSLFVTVVAVQVLMSVLVLFSVFSVLVYSTELVPWYLLLLIFNLVIGGLLLLPSRSRAFFGVGAA